LYHQPLGDGPREAHVHTSVNQRLHEQEDVGRAGAAERRRHVEILLVLDEHLFAHRLQDLHGLLALRVGHGAGARPHRDALADLRRRVGHHAHDVLVAAQPFAQRGDGDAGSDGEDEGIRLDRAAQVGQHFIHDLRFDGEHDDVGMAGATGVVGTGVHLIPVAHQAAPVSIRLG